MAVVVTVFAALAAVLHLFFFAMESLWWTKPAIYRRFRSTAEVAQTTKSLAFNQGFYNLFLAAGTFAGLALLATGHVGAGRLLIGWNCASMVAAAVVLVTSSPKMFRGALIQGVAPLIAVLALLYTRFG